MKRSSFDLKCVVIEYLEGSLSDGGAETLVKDYALLLDKSEFEPIILVDWIFKDTANYKRLKDSGVRIVSLYPHYSVFWRAVNKFFRNSYINYKLERVIKRIKPNVIHAHLACLNHLCAVKGSLKGVRLLYTCHSEPWFYFDKKPLEQNAAKELIRDCGLRMIALRDDMRSELNRRFHVNDSIVIRNGIDLTRFKASKSDGQNVRDELSIPHGAFVVGHIGRFAEEKNHFFLLRVFSEILKMNEESHLLLVGSGELESSIRDCIKKLGVGNNVTILSNRCDIPRLLNSMDVFVFPSLFEGLGIALVEAQAVGLRCVVSDTVNPEAFVTNRVVLRSLEESPEEWARCALDGTSFGHYENRLPDYDVKMEVKKLERLYLGE